ncbi:MAG: 4-hydroxyphenylacetate 3-hydroxylase family protein [Advenella sp.]|nr:4-hydroxyphenylacetate 3-hydroxylase N-terminal domain-containing protein [Advenella sp. FME57]
MLRTGEEYLKSLRDGRRVYIGGELVTDVTKHPAFRNAAGTYAKLFDYKRTTPGMSFEENGQRYSFYYMQPRNIEDLKFRSNGHKLLADFSYGLLGRSPDHVSSFVTGMTLKPDIFDLSDHGFRQNIEAYYRYLRDNDLYVTYAVHPPAGAKNWSSDAKEHLFDSPSLQVIASDESGVTIHGMKMLATGGAFVDEVWIGNLSALAPGREKEAITCALPVATPGISLWSRKSMEAMAESAFDNPLSSRFDESDMMLFCDQVKVPWNRIFTLGHIELSRSIYVDTAGHCFGNHQSNVRFWSKLQFILGLANKICQSGGVRNIPAVQDTLGRLAAYEASLAAMIAGQILAFEEIGEGLVLPNRRYMYATLNWCQENYVSLCTAVRELMGGSVFQMPANVSVIHDESLNAIFEEFWSTDHETALDRMKLYKLAWDMLGSEFASRHLQYENFYAGPSFVVRAYSLRQAPWKKFDAIVEDFMATYDHTTSLNPLEIVEPANTGGLTPRGITR